MYRDLIGKQVTVIVANRGDTNLEYIGTLDSIETEKNLAVLTNVNIRIVVPTIGRTIFGENNPFMTIHQNLAKAVINLEHIVSINA